MYSLLQPYLINSTSILRSYIYVRFLYCYCTHLREIKRIVDDHFNIKVYQYIFLVFFFLYIFPSFHNKINCIFFTISIGIKQYIFISIILLKPNIRKLEVPTLTTKLIISILEYKMIATFMIVEDSYSDSRMTSNSWFKRLAGILTLILVGSVDAKGLGGMVNLSPSPSNIWTTTFIEGRSTGCHWMHQSPTIASFLQF